MKKLFFDFCIWGLILFFLSVIPRWAEAGHLEQALFCEREYNLNEALQTINEALGKSGAKVNVGGGHEITVGTFSAPSIAFNDAKYTVCVTITGAKD